MSDMLANAGLVSKGKQQTTAGHADDCKQWTTAEHGSYCKQQAIVRHLQLLDMPLQTEDDRRTSTAAGRAQLSDMLADAKCYIHANSAHPSMIRGPGAERAKPLRA